MPAHIVDGRSEALPFEAASFDCVVCTFTLCSVQDPAAALAEARRVLKPKGRLIFCEHGLAPDAEVVKWQRRIEPVWKRLAGGCHLTRPVAPAIQAAGFRLARLETMYLPGTPRWAGWNEWGEATPA
jgi:SAM-dependent methyltransferase